MEINNYRDQMVDKSDRELLDIVVNKRNDYEAEAVVCAESILRERHIDYTDETVIDEFQKTNYKYVEEQKEIDEAHNNITNGILLCAGGVIVTAITYLMTSITGGVYLFAWGAIVYGAIKIIKGYSQKANK